MNKNRDSALNSFSTSKDPAYILEERNMSPKRKGFKQSQRTNADSSMSTTIKHKGMNASVDAQNNFGRRNKQYNT